MWRVRKKEIELEDEIHKGKSREESSSSQMKQNGSFLKRSLDKRCNSGDEKMVTCASSSKRWYSEDDEGLGDDDIETFLHSRRKKRGRGSIGPMMDETGPYLPAENRTFQSCDRRERKVVLGPERPPSLTQGSDNEHGLRIRKDYMKKHCKNDKIPEKKRKRDRH
ncbi:hypothetical protein ISN44_As08g032980 [Arabidopsis suecica]|nr:hypothetical protein ISN44_As08g032980 [Arabidopsis suecica]